MRFFLQNKLWRDKAVELMNEMGSKIHWKRLDDTAYDQELRLKMLEEAQEVVATKSSDALMSECADVLEVMQALCAVNNISWDDVLHSQAKKRVDRGGFDERKYVTIAEHPVGGFGEKYCLNDPEKYPEVTD